MKSDMNDLKKLVFDMMRGEPDLKFHEANSRAIKNLFRSENMENDLAETEAQPVDFNPRTPGNIQDTEEVVEESLSLSDKEVEMIKKALEKYNGKRKLASAELGISERTLYRKIKEYGIEM